MIEYRFQFAELIVQISSEHQLEIEEHIKKFVYDGNRETDVYVQVICEWNDDCLPKCKFVGEDDINGFYKEDDISYCTMRGGTAGVISSTRYDEKCRAFQCAVNVEKFPNLPGTVGMVMRMLPMKEIFVQHGILFFHASQILYRENGIMFTAPSGTGKTTQAKLWEKYRNAEIICNDRTLVRKIEGEWYAYGYPIDGSEAVRSSKVTKLGCIVVLEQARNNLVKTVGVAKAATSLMSQLVLDVWNVNEKIRAMELILSLVEEYPIYLFKCTKDEEAIETLEKVLVMSNLV